MYEQTRNPFQNQGEIPEEGLRMVVSGLSEAGVTHVAFQLGCGYPFSSTLKDECYGANIYYDVLTRDVQGIPITVVDLAGQTAFLDKATGERPQRARPACRQLGRP